MNDYLLSDSTIPVVLFSVIHEIGKSDIEQGSVYINVMERDLVILIEKTLEQKLQVGNEVGVISYNEIPLKKIILNGIATVSTDFQSMGQQAARLILNNSKAHTEVPYHLNLRDSL